MHRISLPIFACLLVLGVMPGRIVQAQARPACNGQAMRIATMAGRGSSLDARALEEEHNRRCALGTMLTIAEDARQVLRGITLEKAQNDSSKVIGKIYLEREKQYAKAFGDSVRKAPPPPDTDLRALYFARGMQETREANFAALRGILGAQQVARFDSNLVALRPPPK